MIRSNVFTNGIRWLVLHSRPLLLPVHRYDRQLLVNVHRSVENDERLDICLAELEQIHSIINWYDDAVMRKKTWCIAIWMWVTAFGVYQRDTLLVLVGLASVVGFGLSELVLRRYQRRYVVRAEQLERMLAAGDLTGYRFEMAETPGRSDRRSEFWYALKQPHFTLYYSFYGSNSVGYAIFLGL